jgi:hypothetical protein
MADQLVDSIAPTDLSPSPWSILNKMPTKRLDAAISRAAEQGIPEQGAQLGGYAPQHQHLSHIPLFPLYSQEQQQLLARQQTNKERLVKHMDKNDPDKNLTSGQKMFMNVMGHVSGGANIVSMKRWERRLQGANVIGTNSLMKQNKLVVFTRWAVPALPGGECQGATWFVDVLEHRILDTAWGSTANKMGGNVVMLKMGIQESVAKKVNLQLLKTEAKGLKTQKTWTKRINYDPCDAITFVGESQILAMEIVARIQRACSSLEAHEIQKRFDKQWLVPVVQ